MERESTKLPRLLLGAIAFSLASGLIAPQAAQAIPAFARRYEYSCNNCHQFHYPRLNSFGKRFRENGYQLPEGAEDAVRASRDVEPGVLNEVISILRDVPLSLRGQVFGVVAADPQLQERKAFETRLFSFLMGGGTISEDISFFFSWTPFPDPAVHQARIGFHNILEDSLGAGTLNARAGALFLLDFQRPGHRFLAPGPNSAGSVPVGLNGFALEDPNLGVQIYGRPLWGPFMYELAVVAGDQGENGIERDDWKDLFARVSYTLFQNTSHELTTGLFGYLGRTDIETTLGGINLNIRDDFWIAGVDLELDLGPVNLATMGYLSRHNDPSTTRRPVLFGAVRVEAILALTDTLMTSVRYEQVHSDDDPTLRRAEIAPHITYNVATNAMITLAFRIDLYEPAARSSWVVVLDGAF